MFKNKLVVFVIKRIAIFFLLFSIVAFFLNNRWLIIAGLLCGAILSEIRFISNAWIFIANQKQGSIKKSTIFTALVFIFNQIATVLLLYLFYIVNIWVFMGFVAGVLLAPFTIIINSFTEVLGLTKNNFYVE